MLELIKKLIIKLNNHFRNKDSNDRLKAVLGFLISLYSEFNNFDAAAFEPKEEAETIESVKSEILKLLGYIGKIEFTLDIDIEKLKSDIDDLMSFVKDSVAREDFREKNPSLSELLSKLDAETNVLAEKFRQTFRDKEKILEDQRRALEIQRKDEEERKAKEEDEQALPRLFTFVDKFAVLHGVFKDNKLKGEERKLYFEMRQKFESSKSDIRRYFRMAIESKKINRLTREQCRDLAANLTLSTFCDPVFLSEFSDHLVRFKMGFSESDLDDACKFANLFASQRVVGREIVKWIFSLACGLIGAKSRIRLSEDNLRKMANLIHALGIIRDVNAESRQSLLMSGEINEFVKTLFYFLKNNDNKIFVQDKENERNGHKYPSLSNCIRIFCSQLSGEHDILFSSNRQVSRYLPTNPNLIEGSFYSREKETKLEKEIFTAIIKNLLPHLKDKRTCVSKASGKQINSGYQHPKQTDYYIEREYRIPPYNFDIVIQRGLHRHVIEANGDAFHFLMRVKKDGSLCGNHLDGKSHVKELFILNHQKLVKDAFRYSFSNISQEIWNSIRSDQVAVSDFLMGIIPRYFWVPVLPNDMNIEDWLKPTRAQDTLCVCEHERNEKEMKITREKAMQAAEFETKAAKEKEAHLATAAAAVVVANKTDAATTVLTQNSASAAAVASPDSRTLSGTDLKTQIDNVQTANPVGLTSPVSNGAVLGVFPSSECLSLLQNREGAYKRSVEFAQIAFAYHQRNNYQDESRYLNNALICYRIALSCNNKLNIHYRNGLEENIDQWGNIFKKDITCLSIAYENVLQKLNENIRMPLAVTASTNANANASATNVVSTFKPESKAEEEHSRLQALAMGGAMCFMYPPQQPVCPSHSTPILPPSGFGRPQFLGFSAAALAPVQHAISPVPSPPPVTVTAKMLGQQHSLRRAAAVARPVPVFSLASAAQPLLPFVAAYRPEPAHGHGSLDKRQADRYPGASS